MRVIRALGAVLLLFAGVTWALAEYVVRRINDFAPSAERKFVLGLPTGS